MPDATVSEKAREGVRALFRHKDTPLSVKMTLGYDPSPLLAVFAAFEAEVRRETVEQCAEVAEEHSRFALHGEMVFAREHSANIATAIRAILDGEAG